MSEEPSNRPGSRGGVPATQRQGGHGMAIGALPLPPVEPTRLQRALRWVTDRLRPWNPRAEEVFRYRGVPLVGDGYLESPDGPVRPEGLYLAQLAERLGEQGGSGLWSAHTDARPSQAADSELEAANGEEPAGWVASATSCREGNVS